MAVLKDGKTGWRVVYRYVDFKGETKQTQKRGFKTQKAANNWEEEHIKKQKFDLGMTFGSFTEIYIADKEPRIRESTMRTKLHIIRTKFLPYFKDRRMVDIQPRDIIKWQNEMLRSTTSEGKPLSPDYLRTLHAQLSAIFNHAVQYYELSSNPVRKAGIIGEKDAREMLFWTREEYNRFAEEMMDNPVMYYAFEVFYWTGCRCGELLALTPADWDFEKNMLRINKSYQRIDGRDVITDPKTPKSNRLISIPEFLAEEIQDYLKMHYGIQSNDRMFLLSKHSLHRALQSGAEAAGVKKIRVHDLRHSLLFEMGYSAVAIAERVGHRSIDITYRYAHMFPSVQKEMAVKLDQMRRKDEDVAEEA
jgi:integrase